MALGFHAAPPPKCLPVQAIAPYILSLPVKFHEVIVFNTE